MKTRSFSFTAATLAVLTASSAHAGLIIPSLASQEVSASVSLTESGPHEDSYLESSTLPESFSGSAEAKLPSPPYIGNAHSLGTIDSMITQNAISVSGTALSTAQASGMTGDSASATASSWFTFTFEVSEPVNYSIGGSVTASGLGSISGTVSLTEDGTGLFSYSESDGSFSNSGLLSPGSTYVLAATADVISLDMFGLPDDNTASFGFEFSVQAVPEPQGCVFLAGLGLAVFAASRRSRA